MEQKDIDKLRDAMKELSSVSDLFSERRMNKSIRQALKGKSIENVEIETLADKGERDSCLK